MQLCFSLWHLYISFYSTFAHKNVNQSLNSNWTEILPSTGTYRAGFGSHSCSCWAVPLDCGWTSFSLFGEHSCWLTTLQFTVHTSNHMIWRALSLGKCSAACRASCVHAFRRVICRNNERRWPCSTLCTFLYLSFSTRARRGWSQINDLQTYSVRTQQYVCTLHRLVQQNIFTHKRYTSRPYDVFYVT